MADRECCSSGGCRAPRPRLDRRAFLALSTLGTTGAILGADALGSRLGIDPDEVVLVSPEKGIDEEHRRALTRRGEPTSWRGDALGYIGMPVGGITAGRLYLGGDGRLWLWDVYNPDVPTASGWEGKSYQTPLTPTSPFRQGFAIRTVDGDVTRTRSLDSEGFSEVTFTGKYPIGSVHFADDDSPVEVRLDAFSPFVPLDYEASSLPATMLVYEVTNTSKRRIRVTMAAWSENPVCLDNRTQRPLRFRGTDFSAGGAEGLEFSVADGVLPDDPRPDILFEDFEGTTYDGWTVEGTAFGSGPVEADSVPDYFKRFGDLNVHGTKFVTSHAFRDGEGDPDVATGKLISREFTIERRFVSVGVGGGHWDETRIDLVVDGTVVASLSGNDTEPLRTRVFDVRKYEGRTARLEIVDEHTGGWGHINCDHIVFTDAPDLPPMERLQDNGTFALAVLDEGASVHPSLADAATLDAIFDSPDGPRDIDAADGPMTGAVRSSLDLRPGESRTVRFVVGWYFPVPREGQFDWLADFGDGHRHHYAGRFDSASDVIAHLARNRKSLETATRRFVETWYDRSTLPYWFLERTLAPASTLATTTCYRFANGRFYGEEGEYCCDGTCQHVWNYA
ncbi:MAG TPA: GH116 family glycosyl-hydrolase, partial [Actinopolymorphaceae bacterium]